MSRATAYRRLERLTSAGLVASRTTVESGGHHRQQFRLVLDELAIVIDEDGFDCTARTGDCPDA
jgi:predicted transcriptional regulator